MIYQSKVWLLIQKAILPPNGIKGKNHRHILLAGKRRVDEGMKRGLDVDWKFNLLEFIVNISVNRAPPKKKKIMAPF